MSEIDQEEAEKIIEAIEHPLAAESAPPTKVGHESRGNAEAKERANMVFCAEFMTAWAQGHPFPATRAAEVMIESGVAQTAGDPEKFGEMMYKRRDVKTNITEAMRKAMRRLEMTAESLVQLLIERALFDPAEVFDVKNNPLPIRQIPYNARRHIQGWDAGKQKFMFADRDAAIKLLANHLNVGTDKLDVTANIDFAAAVLGSMPEEERPEGWERMGIPYDKTLHPVALPAPKKEDS